MIKIKPELAEKLRGKEYRKSCKYNVVEGKDKEFYISEEEFNYADPKAKEELKEIDLSKDLVTKESYELVKVDKEAEEKAKEIKAEEVKEIKRK